jgi:hypothetical protein
MQIDSTFEVSSHVEHCRRISFKAIDIERGCSCRLKMIHQCSVSKRNQSRQSRRRTPRSGGASTIEDFGKSATRDSEHSQTTHAAITAPSITIASVQQKRNLPADLSAPVHQLQRRKAKSKRDRVTHAVVTNQRTNAVDKSDVHIGATARASASAIGVALHCSHERACHTRH